MARTDGGYGVPGMPGNNAVRFNPANLYFQPGPGYYQAPGYSPFREDQDRDRFILHDPRSGVAVNNNPLQDPRFKIRGGESPYRQPVLPNERSPEEDIPFLMPSQPQLPAAGVGNIGGLLAQQPQNPSQDVSGFEKLLEGIEKEQRMRMRGADQMQVGPNQFVTYPTIQRRPF